MVKNLAYYMGLNYFKVVLAHPDQGKYQVIYPELPGCMGWISMDEDVDKYACSLLRQWITDALKDGYPVPEP